MPTKYERDIYLFLSLYRFFAYGLAVILIQAVRLDPFSGPSIGTYLLLILIGIYTLLKVLGPLRWWRQDHTSYVVIGGDVLVCLLVLLQTGGIDSPYLLYSLSPVVASTLLFQERMAIAGAAVLSVSVTLAHLTSAWLSTDYTWVLQGNYLLWLMLYVTATFVIATSVYRANLNIRGRIESDLVQDERRRMRGEMHDGLAENFAYLSTKIESAGKLIGEKRPSEAQAVLKEVRSVAKDAIGKARESIDQLSVEPFPLIPVLEEYVEELAEWSGVQIHFEADSVTSVLPPTAEVQILRIVQEALANVWHHAQAANAWVTLSSTRQEVNLVVRDDGKGFSSNINGEQDSGLRGLRVMRERAESLGGTFEFTSEPGQGTLVRVAVPRGRSWG